MLKQVTSVADQAWAVESLGGRGGNLSQICDGRIPEVQ